MSIRLVKPVLIGIPTDPFGWRAAIPGVVPAMLHDGQDYAAPAGTPIYAAHDGVIVASGWDPWGWTGAGYGAIIRSHDGRYETRYWHMLGLPLQVGTVVRAGITVIGHVGTTGNSTGPHLHFTLAIGGSPVNPVPYITASLPPKPTPAPKPREEEQMPKAHSIKEYNEVQAIPAGKWTTLRFAKGRTSFMEATKKFTRGTVYITVHSDKELLGRMVYVTVSADGKKTYKSSGSVKLRLNAGADAYVWPFELPANTGGDKFDRIRFQVYPVKGASKVTAVRPIVHYYE